MQLLLSVAALLGAAAAAPGLAPRQAPPFTSKSFRLVAHVTTPNPQFNPEDYVVSHYTTGPGESIAFLVPASVDAGTVFYLNGTAQEVIDRQATIQTGNPVSIPTPFCHTLS